MIAADGSNAVHDRTHLDWRSIADCRPPSHAAVLNSDRVEPNRVAQNLVDRRGNGRARHNEVKRSNREDE